MEEGVAVKRSNNHESMESVLKQQIAENPRLVRGRLENGLEYVILPNETPPARFEAHLEVHAGCIPSYLYGPNVFELLLLPKVTSRQTQSLAQTSLQALERLQARKAANPVGPDTSAPRIISLMFVDDCSSLQEVWMRMRMSRE